MNVTLRHSGDIITVDEDDLEKANPCEQDLVEDLCNLKHLNEASVLHCIRQRFGNNLIHTKAGNVLIVVNPMQPLSLYSEKVVSMFRGCKTEDTPPHIYSMSQGAYRSMIATKRDQSIGMLCDMNISRNQCLIDLVLNFSVRWTIWQWQDGLLQTCTLLPVSSVGIN